MSVNKHLIVFETPFSQFLNVSNVGNLQELLSGLKIIIITCIEQVCLAHKFQEVVVGINNDSGNRSYCHLTWHHLTNNNALLILPYFFSIIFQIRDPRTLD